jgi:hypothetical protein
VSALAELAELRQAVESAERRVADARAEQGRAQRRLEAARTNLRLCDRDDVARLADVTSELSMVMAEVIEVPRAGGGVEYRDLAADERHAQAVAELDAAREAVESWRWTHAAQAGEELREQAREVAARYRPVLDQVQQLERDYAGLLAQWANLLEPLGIAADELPNSPVIAGRFDAVAPPMPLSLQRPDEMTPEGRARRDREDAHRRELERRRQAAADIAAQQATASGTPEVDPATGRLEVPTS